MFQISEKINFLEVSKIAHKDNIYSFNHIDSVLKLIALELILGKMNLKEIISLENNHEVNNILEEFSKKNKVKFIKVTKKRLK